jgi:hypothetical protein
MIERFRREIEAVARTWAWLGRHVDVQITSWWRSAEHNAATAGAASYSQHLVGTAIDGMITGLTRAEALPYVQRVAAAFGAEAPTKGSEGSGASVHVQALPYGMVERLVKSGAVSLAGGATFVGPPRPTALTAALRESIAAALVPARPRSSDRPA